MMFDGFSHVMLFVNNVSASVEWYTKNLGFEVNYQAEEYYASLRHDGMKMRLDLHPDQPGDGNVGKGAWIYFRVSDIHKAISELAAKGIQCSEPRREGDSPFFAQFNDCNGNFLGLIEMK